MKRYRILQIGGTQRDFDGNLSASGVKFLSVTRDGLEIASLNLETPGADVFDFLSTVLDLEVAVAEAKKKESDGD